MILSLIDTEAKIRGWERYRLSPQLYSRDQWASPVEAKDNQFLAVEYLHAYFFDSSPIAAIEGQFSVDGISLDKSNMIVQDATMGVENSGGYVGSFGFTLTSDLPIILTNNLLITASPASISYLAHAKVITVTQVR